MKINQTQKSILMLGILALFIVWGTTPQYQQGNNGIKFVANYHANVANLYDTGV